MSSETQVETPKEQRFEKMVTVMIASVAIWVAITAYFQNYASNISDQARRRPGKKARSGKFHCCYKKGSYRLDPIQL